MLMQTQTHRRSARIAIHMPVEVAGQDLNGRSFCDMTRTESVSEHGGCVLVKRRLEPQQLLRLRRPQGEEIVACVVGEVKSAPEGTLYGISFVDGSFAFWGIHFPSAGSSNSHFRVLLECEKCMQREVVPLTEMQLEFLVREELVMRQCRSCHTRTGWFRTEYEVGRRTQDKVVPISAPKTQENRRKGMRARLELTACIRKPGSEEVVPIMDVSRGGLRFRSERAYATGSWVQVAVPFTKNAANIFVPAQVVWQDSDAAPLHEYGLKYLK